EVLIVVGMIGVLSAIAIPSYIGWLPNSKLKSATREMYSTLQKARALAVKTNRDTAVIFDPANNKYDLCDDWVAGACAGSAQTMDIATLGYGVGCGHGNATTPVPGGAFPGDDVSYSAPVNVATFNSRGLGNAGYVYLDHQNNTTTYAVGSLSSGSIRILKWQGGAWE
ncbi:MAG: GspH/FimT family pseudopilin, partial [Desulfuromusa sp.]|nr:GspH/FimT family pseudopilin [Desulfuromusa sp.]